MKNSLFDDIEMDLCGACEAQLKADGRDVRVVFGAANQKVTCAICGRRRYGAKFSVSKEIIK